MTAKTVWCMLPDGLKKSMNWILNDDGEILGWHWLDKLQVVPAPRTDPMDPTADEMVASAIRAQQACIDKLAGEA